MTLSSGLDPQAVITGLPTSVPFVRSLGIEITDVREVDGVIVAEALLPDVEGQRNHVGGPHAGAMFTVGESASGAVVLAGFADLLDRATPLAVSAEIRYLRLARGPVRAVAATTRPVADVRAELAAGRRPEFTVTVSLLTEDGETGRLDVLWTLRPHRSDG
jgi:acyl-coenzyme A thioesterase PaaI-like protein